jgi:hypothetical protein
VLAQVTDIKKRTTQHKGHDLKLQNRTSHLHSHVQIWVITFDMLTENHHQHKQNPKDFCKFLIIIKSVNLCTASTSAFNSINIIQGVSVNQAILQHCFFWFDNTKADAAIAILLPTLKRFSCNVAVDWSTTCFCCESVLQKQ